jgi:hypothetical protein
MLLSGFLRPGSSREQRGGLDSDETKEEKTYPVQTWKRGADHPSNQNETHFA